MKLYLVWGTTTLVDDFGEEIDLTSLYGVFSTREKAENAMKSLSEKSVLKGSEDYLVEEWELDKPSPMLSLLI